MFKMNIIFLTFFVCCSMIPHTKEDEHCEKREKSLAILDIAKDSVMKANDHYQKFALCGNTSIIPSDSKAKEKTLFYLESSIKLMIEVKESIEIGSLLESKKRHEKPMDCFEVLQNGYTLNGVYSIWLMMENKSYRRLEVFCDMTTTGGGWTVIQRRGNFTPQEDFYQGWNKYKTGFGNVEKDHWLGNENLFLISNQAEYKIRFDLQDVEGEKAYAQYQMFWIDYELSQYALHIRNYSGNAGDNMAYHNGMKFSTIDRDNDNYTTGSCSKLRQGSWWFNRCSHSNPNGLYQPGVTDDDYKGFYWSSWRKSSGLAAMEIKLTRVEWSM